MFSLIFEMLLFPQFELIACTESMLIGRTGEISLFFSCFLPKKSLRLSASKIKWRTYLCVCSNPEIIRAIMMQLLLLDSVIASSVCSIVLIVHAFSSFAPICLFLCSRSSKENKTLHTTLIVIGRQLLLLL